ncbi:MAG: hypothetical protein PUB09_07330 [Firmicutes bacterium]|nr:hypothetical protein [Bacillota bacterium]
MEPRLTEIEFDEIIANLENLQEEITPEIEEEIRACAKKVTEAADPKFTYMMLPIYDREISGCPIEGNDIGEFLATSNQALLFAATLGNEVEEMLLGNGEDARAEAIMNACARAAIENVVGNFENDFAKAASYQGLFLTDRFCPGNGDMPAGEHQRICDILYTTKRIGLDIADAEDLTPRSWMSAIIGISEIPQR